MLIWLSGGEASSIMDLCLSSLNLDGILIGTIDCLFLFDGICDSKIVTLLTILSLNGGGSIE